MAIFNFIKLFFYEFLFNIYSLHINIIMLHVEIFILYVDIIIFSIEGTQRITVVKDFCFYGVDKRRMLNVNFTPDVKCQTTVEKYCMFLNGIRTCPSQNASFRICQSEKIRKRSLLSRE